MSFEPADITVIVRTSGRARCYLERAVASIRAQTRKPAHVIISDDAATGVALPTHEDLPFVWVSRKPEELPSRSKALNRAIERVATPWVAFLDDDDTWRPDFLERMSEAAVRVSLQDEIGAICCRTEARYEDEVEGQFVEFAREPFNPDLVELSLSDLVQRNRFTNNAVIWRRQVFEKVGGYRDDLEVLEDWEFNVRAASRFRMTVVPMMLAHYHQRPRMRGKQEANSSIVQHDRGRERLAQEWRSSGLLPPDKGGQWIRNRLREVRHRWARWRFATRWRGAE